MDLAISFLHGHRLEEANDVLLEQYMNYLKTPPCQAALFIVRAVRKKFPFELLPEGKADEWAVPVVLGCAAQD